jgi:hypothetical protein
VGVIGVVLVGSLGGQHSDARRQRGGNVEHVLSTGNELLGQQIAQPTHRFDGPGALFEGFSPQQELVDLAER